jgi:hypothetical protein
MASSGTPCETSPHRFSAIAGVSLVSQSRTASWLKTMPRIRNISGRSRRASDGRFGTECTAQGYRRFRCRTCGKQFNERSVGVLNRTQYPSDVIALVVLWRLRYKLSYET